MASILRRSAFLIVQLSHPYVTTGKTIALTKWTFVGKVMSLFFNTLSREEEVGPQSDVNGILLRRGRREKMAMWRQM